MNAKMNNLVVLLGPTIIIMGFIIKTLISSIQKGDTTWMILSIIAGVYWIINFIWKLSRKSKGTIQ